MDDMATHYADLAQSPGWLEYAQHRVAQMEAEKGGYFVGLRLLVRQELAKRKGAWRRPSGGS